MGVTGKTVGACGQPIRPEAFQETFEAHICRLLSSIYLKQSRRSSAKYLKILREMATQTQCQNQEQTCHHLTLSTLRKAQMQDKHGNSKISDADYVCGYDDGADALDDYDDVSM